MPKNKKSLAGTSESIQIPLKLYPKPKRISNSLESAIMVALILITAISVVAFLLFVLWLIYVNGLAQ